MASSSDDSQTTTTTTTSILASCPHCSQVKLLEACIDCYQPLCGECMTSHMVKWKQEASDYCSQMDKRVDEYLSKIRVLDPLMSENRANVTKVKAEIENIFIEFIDKLNNEKQELFNKLDQIEAENQKFNQLEEDIMSLKANINEFQDTTVDETNSTTNFQVQLNKFHDCKDRIDTIGNNYTDLKNKPFKIIGEFEKPQTINLNHFFGNLIVNESDLLLRQQRNSLASIVVDDNNNNDKVHMFGTLRVKLRKLAADQMNEPLLSNVLPSLLFDTIQPNNSYLTSYKNRLVLVDRAGTVNIYDYYYNANQPLCKHRSSTHVLNIPNVQACATCSDTLAVAFCDLSKEQMKQMAKLVTTTTKKTKLGRKSGILMFKMGGGDKLKLERLIDLNKCDGFKSPCGLALGGGGGDTLFLFVCDRDLHSLLKFDAKCELVQQLALDEPVGVALSESGKYLAITDGRKHHISLVDADKLIRLRTVKLVEEFQSLNGLYDICTLRNELIFVKNRSDTKVMVYDWTLKLQSSFEYDSSQLQGFTSLASTCVVLGITNKTTTKQSSSSLAFFNL